MDDHQNGFDQQAEQAGPPTDDSANPTEAAPDQSQGAEQTDKPKVPAGREMLIQLQQMIDTIAYQAAPVVREVGAKAAELAAAAGSKAGPIAHKAADATEQFGQRVAARSSAMAADLRKPREDAEASTERPAGDGGDSGASTSTGDGGGQGGEVGQPWSTEPGPGESSEHF